MRIVWLYLITQHSIELQWTGACSGVLRVILWMCSHLPFSSIGYLAGEVTCWWELRSLSLLCYSTLLFVLAPPPSRMQAEAAQPYRQPAELSCVHSHGRYSPPSLSYRMLSFLTIKLPVWYGST